MLIDGAGSVANSGLIRADAANSFDRAVRLNSGGNVSNAASGTIAGDSVGVYIVGAAGTVSNAGSVSAGNPNGGVAIFLAAGGSIANTAATASVHGFFVGVEVFGGTGTVTNSGSITASVQVGVELAQGGSVTNGQSGSSGGYIYGYSSGIYIYGRTNGGTSLGTGTVTNFGTVSSNSDFGNNGIALMDGGTVTNGASGASSAYVHGNSYGVLVEFLQCIRRDQCRRNRDELRHHRCQPPPTVAGVGLRSGGIVINAKGATITGAYGVSAIGYGNYQPDGGERRHDPRHWCKSCCGVLSSGNGVAGGRAGRGV